MTKVLTNQIQFSRIKPNNNNCEENYKEKQ